MAAALGQVHVGARTGSEATAAAEGFAQIQGSPQKCSPCFISRDSVKAHGASWAAEQGLGANVPSRKPHSSVLTRTQLLLTPSPGFWSPLKNNHSPGPAPLGEGLPLIGWNIWVHFEKNLREERRVGGLPTLPPLLSGASESKGRERKHRDNEAAYSHVVIKNRFPEGAGNLQRSFPSFLLSYPRP